MRLLVIFVILGLPIGAQDCEKMTYANDNQIETGDVMIVARVKGTAADVDGAVIPDVCIGIFSINSHVLLAFTSTDTDGCFEFKNLKDGMYRLVAKYDYFTAANHLIRVDSQDDSKIKLLIRMKLCPDVSCFEFE